MIHTLPVDKHIQYLVGCSIDSLSSKPMLPYNDLVCEFLSELSRELLSEQSVKIYPDVVSFAYWCRKANVSHLKQKFGDDGIRIGLGLVFHIAPSNVPVNFAFSFVFSLLAGNANIVKVPNKNFEQVDIICKAIKTLFVQERFSELARSNVFIRHEDDNTITGEISSKCDARIIWGGDRTIKEIRKVQISPRGVDIAFADRYSMCIINAKSILDLNGLQLNKLSTAFYNDVYLMDQNACSSPHLIAWLGVEGNVDKAKEIFWKAVYENVKKKYELHAVLSVDKYAQFCCHAIEREEISALKRHDNYIYRIDLTALHQDLDRLRGKCGYFFEYRVNDINELAKLITKKYQTMTYFGLDKMILSDFVTKNNLLGIDRIVPIGSALDISVIWDGYDLVRTLSRICDIR